MKKVVALNQNYFYDKGKIYCKIVKVTDDTKPSQYRLKIPVHMLRSNYKNEFFKKCVEHKTDLIINNDYET